jgi:hypothetical protein
VSEESTAEVKEGVPSDEASESSVDEDFLSACGDDLRAAVKEIFSGESFSYELETDSGFHEDEHSRQDEHLDESWEDQREELFPSRQPLRESEDTGHVTPGPGPSTTPVNNPTAKEDTLVLFLLQVPKGGLEATFTASEDTSSPFAGQLRLYSEDANAPPGEASEFDVNLPPEGLVRLSTGKVGNNGHEWALISLDEEARAYATFDLRAGRNLKATAAVFSKTPSRRASVPLKTSLSEDSGLVLANPTDEPVIVKLSLFDEQGDQVGSLTSQDPIPPGKQIAVFAKGIFGGTPGISSFEGRMEAEVVGDGLIWSAGLDQNEGILSFLPVYEMEQAPASQLTTDDSPS